MSHAFDLSLSEARNCWYEGIASVAPLSSINLEKKSARSPGSESSLTKYTGRVDLCTADNLLIMFPTLLANGPSGLGNRIYKISEKISTF
jgi:hypothetical protein